MAIGNRKPSELKDVVLWYPSMHVSSACGSIDGSLSLFIIPSSGPLAAGLYLGGLTDLRTLSQTAAGRGSPPRLVPPTIPLYWNA